MARYTFYEFFAGGGMARAGLGDDWQCLFANDFDPKKAAAYRANWGDGEVRFDLAGCLRTPVGGSSRQTILVAESGQIRTRLISARETARLMGLGDDYRLPARYNDAYHLTGDGVAVPVVSWVVGHIVEPSIGMPTPALASLYA